MFVNEVADLFRGYCDEPDTTFLTNADMAIYLTTNSTTLGAINATADGVVRTPSALAITFASPPSMIATHEFVVPKSIPIILPIFIHSLLFANLYDCGSY